MHLPTLYYRLRAISTAEMARRAGLRFNDVMGWKAEEREARWLAEPSSRRKRSSAGLVQSRVSPLGTLLADRF